MAGRSARLGGTIIPPQTNREIRLGWRGPTPRIEVSVARAAPGLRGAASTGRESTAFRREAMRKHFEIAAAADCRPPPRVTIESGERLLEEDQHPAPGLLGLIVVIDSRIGRAPAMGRRIDLDLGVELRVAKRLPEHVLGFGLA
jgi:hypothetical protein